MSETKGEYDFVFELGDRVKDVISGFTGIINSRSQWLYNCNTYGVKSETLHEGKIVDPQYFDEPQLELVDELVFENKRDTEGPCDKIPNTNRF